jgi:hypothetical protein
LNRLPSPPASYDLADQRRTRELIGQALERVHSREGDVNLGPTRLIITDEVTGARYALKVASGVLSIVAI